jgi:hypothetical protein
VGEGTIVRSLVPLSFFVLVLAVGACGDDDATAPSTTGASGGGIEVLGPDAVVNGMSTADLLGTYAVGVAETPADLVDPAKCDMGLSTEDVYFSPTPGEPGDRSTTCTMSADQTLLVAPTSAFCIDAPKAGGTADTACLDSLWDLTSSSVTIDGVEVEGLGAYEVDSEVIDVTLPEGGTSSRTTRCRPGQAAPSLGARSSSCRGSRPGATPSCWRSTSATASSPVR